MADIDSRLAKYARVEASSDIPGLSDSQRAVLGKMIEAAKLMDICFWKQASPDGLELRQKLEASDSELDAKLLHFLMINKCRFDRQANYEPFIGEEPRPAGATLWPENFTAEELEAYLADHPEKKESILSLTTLVRRDGNELTTVPYHVAFSEELRQAAGLLREAAVLTENASLRRYLGLRANSLVTDDYFESDMAWLDLEGNTLDIVIGPIEPYEDGLMNLKTAYEAFVLVKDEAASRELGAYIEAMEEMQQNLPIGEQFKRREVRLGSSVGVFTVVFATGDGDAGIKTIAISLPNDERVRAQKGSRKIMLRNALDAKFNRILFPIAERFIAPEQLDMVDGDLFFGNILLHEVAHSLGNDFVLDAEGNPTATRIDVAMKNHSTVIEECKADIGGLHSAGVMIRRGVIPPEKRPAIYTTYLAGIFRLVRFGTAQSHGVAGAIALNWINEHGGILVSDDGRYSVDEEKFATAVSGLLEELLTIQYTGDYERADALISKYGAVPDGLSARLADLDDIPVDIEFV
jgi:hypothetical protein